MKSLNHHQQQHQPTRNLSVPEMGLMVILIILLLVLHAYANAAQEPAALGTTAADAGLKAEQEGQWAKALFIYQLAIMQEGRSELWVRVANIQAILQKKEAIVAQLTREAKAKPGDKEIFHQLSMAHAELNRPKEALEAIERAVQLDPENTDYLKARAQLANWLGKPRVAANSYRRLIKLLPHDDELLLWLARADTWGGRLDRAAKSYKKYLARKWRPGNLEVLIEYVKVQTWRGDFTSALKLIETYRQKGGNDLIYRQRKADILVRAERPRKGMKELAMLLKQDPGDYELNTDLTIALHYDNRPVEAINSLKTLEELRPQSLENEELHKFLWTPIRHALPAQAQYYSDNIGVDMFTATLDGGIRVNRRIYLRGGYARNFLRAPVETEFNNIDGTEDALHHKQWLGADLRLSRGLKIDGFVGTEKAEELDASVTYAVNARMKLSDTFNITLGRNYGYFLITARTASLGTKMAVNQVNLNWSPGLRYVLPVYGEYTTFTDTNTRWQLIVSPRYAYKRTSRLNLDLGVRAWWYGYKYSNSNGYWSPEFYQSYMGTASGYLKLAENHGIYFHGEAGVLKADNWDRFYFGWAVDAEGMFGIYGDLYLQLRASYMHNRFQDNRVFTAYVLSASLIVRF